MPHQTPVRIAITPGDPAGIGPELVERLLADPDRLGGAQVRLVSHGPPAGGVPVGRPSAQGGAKALGDLREALRLATAGEVDAVVFAPLNKSSLHLAGMAEPDELQWMEGVLGVRGASEVNVLPELTTSRVTSHVALADVAAGVVGETVVARGLLLDAVLRGSRDGDAAAPRIAVCALNPHAGEGGRFGREEIEVIAPAVQVLRERGVDAAGPFPCDTVFVRARRGEFDGVLTMYHDQGQIAMKLMGFDRGVTLAGGLPFPVCTPAHGTAFDLVGTGRADLGALAAAFDLARRLAVR